MAKKRGTPEKKSQKIVPIDYISKYSQHPRSSPPKRRTDFSVFMCSPSSLTSPGSSLHTSSGEVRLSNFTASNLQKRRKDEKPVQCSNSQEDRPEFSKCLDVDQDEGLDLGSDRDDSKEKGDTFVTSESTAHESHVTYSDCLAVTQGSVVWAKTACQVWWPAEIMEEGSTLSDQASDGHVLVQFYGNHPCTWIDPSTDLSMFEDCFEERSGNPSKDFQDALKQALQRKEQLSSCRKLSPDRSVHSDQQDHSSDKWTSSTSSRTKDDILDRRRGKRERKRKVHFDEVTFLPKSERKVRRIKIMRYLGLTAPVGSPF